MNEIVFSQSSITALWIITALCLLVPIVFFVIYFYSRKARISSFFIGTGMALLIVIAGRSILDMFFLLMLGLNNIFDSNEHPIYAVLYASVLNGFLIQFSTYLALRFAMGDKTEKENMFFMTIGKSGLYCLVYGGVSAISYLAIAYTVNGSGIENYLSSIADTASRETQRAAVVLQAAEPAIQIVLDGLLQIGAMCTHIALGTLIYAGLHQAKDILPADMLPEKKNADADTSGLPWFVRYRRLMLPLAIVLQIISFIPVFLLQMGFFTDIAIVIIVLTLIYMAFVCVFCHKVYKQLK